MMEFDMDIFFLTNLQGKPTLATVERRFKQYGEADAKDYIPGTEVLLNKNEESEVRVV